MGGRRGAVLEGRVEGAAGQFAQGQFAHRRPVRLAGGALRNVVDQQHLPGRRGRSVCVGGGPAKRRQVGSLAWPGPDHRDHGGSPFRVGDAGDDDLGNPGDPAQHRLDHGWVDFHPAGDDHVVGPADNADRAGIGQREILGEEGPQAAGVNGERRMPRHVPVAAGDDRSADPDPSDGPRHGRSQAGGADHLPAVVAGRVLLGVDRHAHPVQRHPVIDATATGLAHPVGGDDPGPGLLGIVDQRQRGGRATDQDGGEGGQSGRRLRIRQHPVQLGGYQRGEPAAGRHAVHGGGEQLGGERRRGVQDDGFQTGGQRAEQHLHPGNVVGGQGEKPSA